MTELEIATGLKTIAEHNSKKIQDRLFLKQSGIRDDSPVELTWPDCIVSGAVPQEYTADLIQMACWIGWGCCHGGAVLPPKFGEFMADASRRLGYACTPDNLMLRRGGDV